MERKISLNDKEIKYHLRKSQKARYMRLAISRGGQMVLTLPWLMDESAAETFIREKSDWIIKKITYFEKFKPAYFLKTRRRDYLKYKNAALALAKEKLAGLNKFYGFQINKISIKNQKTRWGSCSRSGNLNFNYKIALLPKKLRDYIIVHELCHLKEFNHSKSFWRLVAKTIPQYKKLAKEIKSL